MKSRYTVVLGVFVMVLLYFHAALAQGTPAQQGFPGHWKLNFKKSDLTSLYGSYSISANLVIEEVGPAKVKYKTSLIDPNGGKHTRTFDAAPDGSLHRLGGSDRNMKVSYVLKGDALEGTWNIGSGDVIHEVTTVSSDGQTLTSMSEGAFRNGVLKWSEVYDREK
jgi:hypothetical protein